MEPLKEGKREPKRLSAAKKFRQISVNFLGPEDPSRLPLAHRADERLGLLERLLTTENGLAAAASKR